MFVDVFCVLVYVMELLVTLAVPDDVKYMVPFWVTIYPTLLSLKRPDSPVTPTVKEASPIKSVPTVEAFESVFLTVKVLLSLCTIMVIPLVYWVMPTLSFSLIERVSLNTISFEPEARERLEDIFTSPRIESAYSGKTSQANLSYSEELVSAARAPMGKVVTSIRAARQREMIFFIMKPPRMIVFDCRCATN